MPVIWHQIATVEARSFVCWACSNRVASNVGWTTQDDLKNIRICPLCGNPTYLDNVNQTFPGAPAGRSVGDLPPDVDALYSEMRKSIASGCFAAAVLVARKILMHVAVEQGASAGLNFVAYVDYLRDNHIVPAQSVDWVDLIRTIGNEANHEIAIPTPADVDRVLAFMEMAAQARVRVSCPSRSTSATVGARPPTQRAAANAARGRLQ